jgi:hypothetical protein
VNYRAAAVVAELGRADADALVAVDALFFVDFDDLGQGQFVFFRHRGTRLSFLWLHFALIWGALAGKKNQARL